MASNVSQRATPNLWTSAGDDVIYTFDFEKIAVLAFSNNAGFLRVQMINGFSFSPSVGDLLFIDNPSFFGTHKIKSDDGAYTYTTETAYVTPTAGGSYVYNLRVPDFYFYKGFKQVEGANNYAARPIELVSIIKPSIIFDSNTLPYLSINVKGLVSRSFEIEENTSANSTDYSAFIAARLEWDGLSTVCVPSTYDYNLILNSAITNDELLDKIGGGFYLIPIDKPLIANSGVSFITWFGSKGEIYPILQKYINGVLQ